MRVGHNIGTRVNKWPLIVGENDGKRTGVYSNLIDHLETLDELRRKLTVQPLSLDVWP